MSILDKTAIGTAVYAEIHSPATNANGLFSTTVGSGTIVAGVFANIDWADGNKFLKSEIDINGGNNFVTVATTQMMSVPYALYAQTAGKASVKTMNDTDLELVCNWYNTKSNNSVFGSKVFGGFYELKAPWKNEVFNVVSKIYVDNQLDNNKSGLDTDFGSKLGILYNTNTFSVNSTFRLVAYFQLENGELYKVQKDLSIPTTKSYVDQDGDNYGNPLSEFYVSNINSLINSPSFQANTKYITVGGDCNDFNPAINPNATEIYGNQIDENCDGVIGACLIDADCPTGKCNTATGQCQALEICNNGIDDDGDGNTDNCDICNNGLDDDGDGLIDEDCLAIGSACSASNTCSSGVCQNGVCQPPSCTDGVKNGNETGVDCGGSCTPCTVQCPVGQVNCGGICVNINTSNTNCGACGNSCPAGTTCVAGTCMP